MKKLIMVVAFAAGVAVGCYATTGPVPNCAQNPNGEGCYGGLTDDPPSWYLNGAHAPDAGAAEAGR